MTKPLSPLVLAVLFFAGAGSLLASANSIRKTASRPPAKPAKAATAKRTTREPGRRPLRRVDVNNPSTPKKPAAAAPRAASATRSAAARRPTTARRSTRRRARVQTAPTPERISEIQEALATKGAYQGDPDGKWDDATVAAMKQFQTANGLSPTGKIDALTLQKLGLGSPVAGRGAPLVPASAKLASPADSGAPQNPPENAAKDAAAPLPAAASAPPSSQVSQQSSLPSNQASQPAISQQPAAAPESQQAPPTQQTSSSDQPSPSQ